MRSADRSSMLNYGLKCVFIDDDYQTVCQVRGVRMACVSGECVCERNSIYPGIESSTRS